MSEKKTVDNAKRIRWIVFVVEMAVIFAAGAIPVTLMGGQISLASTAVTLAAIMLIMGTSAFIQQKYPHIFANQCGEKSGRPVETSGGKKALTTVLQGAFGFCFAFGLIGAVAWVIEGAEYSGSYALYIGSFLLGIAILVVLLGVPAVQEAEFKHEMDAAKKEMKFYENDERMIAISHKAGYYTLWSTLAMLLLFGAALAVFEVESINVVGGGILGICIAAYIIYLALYVVYNENKTDGAGSRKNQRRNRVVIFVLSLLPVGLMAARWAGDGLSVTGRAFLVAFAVVSLVFLANIIWTVRLAKTSQMR